MAFIEAAAAAHFIEENEGLAEVPPALTNRAACFFADEHGSPRSRRRLLV
ncbi:MAG: hypothetical protein ACRDWX_13605 [Acidimicrobiia bacterium]